MYQVVDGQQRLSTLISFVEAEKEAPKSGDFELSKEHADLYQGSTFDQLSTADQDALQDYMISVHILPPAFDDSLVLKVFARLNTSGVKLNDQEVRNALYSGAFKQYSYRVGAGNYAFWSDMNIFNADSLVRMEETQFASDLTLFMLKGLRASNKLTLDKLYMDYEDEFPNVKVWEDRFNQVLSELQAGLTSRSSKNTFRRKSWFYTLFCITHDAMYGTDRENLSVGSNGVSTAIRLPVDFYDRLATLSEKLEDHNLDEGLRKAVRTTNLNSRKVRHDFLGKLVFGDDWVSPYNQL